MSDKRNVREEAVRAAAKARQDISAAIEISGGLTTPEYNAILKARDVIDELLSALATAGKR